MTMTCHTLVQTISLMNDGSHLPRTISQFLLSLYSLLHKADTDILTRLATPLITTLEWLSNVLQIKIKNP